MEERTLYETPRSGSLRKSVSGLLIGSFWFVALMFSYYAVTDQLDFSDSQNLLFDWAIVVFGIFLLIYAPLFLADSFLLPHFEIRENGIIRQVNTVIIVSKKGAFIPYSQMKSFTCSQEGKRCAIHLDPDGYAFYRDKRKEVIATLRDYLIRNGIAEVPSTCAKCGTEHLLKERTCPQCGETRS